jgi:hypothetical protein
MHALHLNVEFKTYYTLFNKKKCNVSALHKIEIILRFTIEIQCRHIKETFNMLIENKIQGSMLYV